MPLLRKRTETRRDNNPLTSAHHRLHGFTQIFILWNNKMDTVEVDKVGSQIDVLPTLYNLFGVSYDSRLIIGKDILSTTEGLAIFGNRSWVSDKGTYFANTKKFVPIDGVKVTDEYINTMNKIVNNKVLMSKNIMENNYYKKVIGD